MENSEKVLEAVKFICDHLGEMVYIVDSMDCDECPDLGKGPCLHRHPGKHSIKAMGDCRSRHVMVRGVGMDLVGVVLCAGEDHVVTVVIDDCYICKPEEIFTTREAATAHMESMPADILKFYPQGGGG